MSGSKVVSRTKRIICHYLSHAENLQMSKTKNDCTVLCTYGLNAYQL